MNIFYPIQRLRGMNSLRMLKKHLSKRDLIYSMQMRRRVVLDALEEGGNEHLKKATSWIVSRYHGATSFGGGGHEKFLGQYIPYRESGFILPPRTTIPIHVKLRIFLQGLVNGVITTVGMTYKMRLGNKHAIGIHSRGKAKNRGVLLGVKMDLKPYDMHKITIYNFLTMFHPRSVW